MSVGSTTELLFGVTNNAGTPETFTNLRVLPDPTGKTSSSLNTADTTCSTAEPAAAGDECILAVNITAQAAGSGQVQVNVCAFNGQLCSQLAYPIDVTTSPTGTFNCSGNAPTCRAFLTTDTVLGDLSYSTGAVDISSCTSFSGLNRGNCICEKEAAAAGYGHAGSWFAWLSNDTVDAKDNIGYTDAITYVRATDTETQIVAAGGLLSAPDENFDNSIAAGPNNDVYTGTNTDGTAIANEDCGGNWVSAKAGSTGGLGNSDGVGAFWTTNGNSTCDTANNLYCFEKP